MTLDQMAPLVAGLDPARDAVLSFQRGKIDARCGIDATTVLTRTRALAQARCAAVYGHMRTSVQAYVTLCARLINVLNVLTGDLDRTGNLMSLEAAAFAANTSDTDKKKVKNGVSASVDGKNRVSGAPEIFGELPMNCLAAQKETEDSGQVKALIELASDFVLSAANGKRLSAALDKLDFMFSMDSSLNETTCDADVIWQSLSPLEYSHYGVPLPQFSFRNQSRYSATALRYCRRRQRNHSNGKPR